MEALNQIQFNNQRVLVRVDFNVPLNGGKVTDNTRIKACIPTIQTIVKNGGRPVLMSHLGRPKGPSEELSMRQLTGELAQLSGYTVVFSEACVGEEAVKASRALEKGQVLLLENLRFHEEETKGDKAFAKALAQSGDFYINDAFGTAHRAHASTAIITEFFEGKCAFGLVMKTEIENVDKVLNAKEKPVTAIVGGAKVSSKISILENLIPKLDHLIIAGGMAYTFVKAQGGKVGESLVEDEYLETARNILKKAKEKGCTIHLPLDSVNADAFSNEANTSVSPIDKIPDGLMGLDVGKKTLECLKPVLYKSKIILWNGPMGVFEMDNFAEGTKQVAAFISEATAKGAFSLVGGGDSVAAVKKFNRADQVSYVSTGGGAMLEYLEGKELPGIKAVLLHAHRG